MNNYRRFHKGFQLNGISFLSEEELLVFSGKISESIHAFLSDWFNERDFVIVQTSGSTGKPKPIKLQKEFIKNSALATGNFFNLKENTTALLCLSTDYIAGKMMLVRALTLGWQLDIVIADSNPLKDKKLLKKHYDFSAMVPLQLRNSLADLHKIDKLIVGGGVVSSDLTRAIQNISTKVFATYGMTETITHIAVKKLNNFKEHEPVSASDYSVLSNVKITVDTRDCLVIEAPKVSEEKIITNDIVKLISATKFQWLGRFDNVINSGGVKLHPEKIEEKLSEIITSRFFVIGISDAILGEKLILIIEDTISDKAKNDFDFEIKNLKTLTRFEIPKEIYFIDDFIETDTKKIQRKKTLEKIILN
ncbi:AMP-binding protein [Tenacibaculum finnmarkense]|uniref:AMP-binding protein n=1 Tax=Tenacibaculum finnmarkense TaxID=2781243 RepID=UPI001EFA78DC|nr:AMP-binding protein [Tenacibaculum finnmarkense]MCG8804704.1 AMP-binding protein [Tenacibaculum finnmarkense]MCG8856462.1 AMP-binding protein [Tenacibaculum finnmarkense]